MEYYVPQLGAWKIVSFPRTSVQDFRRRIDESLKQSNPIDFLINLGKNGGNLPLEIEARCIHKAVCSPDRWR